MRLRVLDLFCGGGGSSLGAQAVGGEIVCGIDAWDIAIKTYQSIFPKARALNIELTEKTRPKDIGIKDQEIDLILASPECTNHTCAKGAKPRCEDSKRTARYILNFASELNPRWIAIENVVQMRNWIGYEPLIDDLRDLGYNIREQIIDASTLGVPQSRRRMFLLCDQERIPDAVPIQNNYFLNAADVLDPVGTWKSRPLYQKNRASRTIERAERAIDALGRGTNFLIVYYGSDASGGWQPLDRPLRTLTTIDRFGLVTWEGKTPMLRMLQVSELKKAMGFEADLLHGTRRDKVKILGNGVCPPVMKAVLGSLINS